MRILHLLYDHTDNPWLGGGAAVRAREIYSRLAERHQITVISGLYPGAQDHISRGVRYAFVGSRRDNYVISTFGFAIEAARARRRLGREADVIVEDFSAFNPSFSFRERRTPVVLQVHHHEGVGLLRRYGPFGFPFFAVERFYPRRFTHASSVSEGTRVKFGLIAHNTPVIENGMDPSLLELPTSDGGYTCYVGRIDLRNKGIDTLLQAIAHVRMPLYVAGRGRDENDVRRIVESLGIGALVRFVGYLPEGEKLRLIANSTCLVLPSRFEGQGIVVFEAAACGKPVIVSDIPELHYAVDAGFARSFPVGDAAALATVLSDFRENPTQCNDMGKRARAFARDFTWDAIAARYEDYLEEVIAGRSPGPRSRP